MVTKHNYLRLYRKQSALTQSDVGWIMGLADISSISRYESGKRKANLEVLLTYHLLFNMPVEKILERQSYELSPVLVEGLQTRIIQLHQEEKDETISKRLDFIKSAITRLTADV